MKTMSINRKMKRTKPKREEMKWKVMKKKGMIKTEGRITVMTRMTRKEMKMKETKRRSTM
jgi:hypothetical protein